MTGCFRNREKIADDLQARGLHDFSQQRIFFFRLEATLLALEKCRGWLFGISWNLEREGVQAKSASSNC